jgi:hypothetical protein
MSPTRSKSLEVALDPYLRDMVSFCVGGDRIAFAAESLTGQEILRTDNVEIRRIEIERLGYETFLHSTPSPTVSVVGKSAAVAAPLAALPVCTIRDRPPPSN